MNLGWKWDLCTSSELTFESKGKEMFLICFSRTHDCITCSSHHFDYVSTNYIAYFSLSFFCCFSLFSYVYVGVLWPWAHLPQVSLVGASLSTSAFENVSLCTYVIYVISFHIVPWHLYVTFHLDICILFMLWQWMSLLPRCG